MSAAIRRAQRVVTDSEDDFSEIRQRNRHDLQLTRRSQTPPIAELDESEAKSKLKRKSTVPPLNSYIHTSPIHTISKPSVLSKEAPPVEGGYHGFIRLGMLVLGASNVRLIIENYMKYGLLIKLPHSYIPYQDYGLFVLAWVSVPVSITSAYLIEVAMAKIAIYIKEQKLDVKQKMMYIETLSAVFHSIHLLFLMIYPSYIVYTKIYHPMVGSAALVIALILFLKLISYSLVNRELRQMYLEGNSETQEASKYPRNITVFDILYFWWAPTLCYQPAYPRSPKFRTTFFLKRVGELVVCLVTMYLLAEQYAKPTLENSLKALEESNYIVIIERVLKLSTTAVVIWLLMFYALFHSFLNALSEVLRFGDRTFYLAWWNSNNLGTYWRLWNRPVYLFFKRHVYLPGVQRGFPPLAGQFLVFLISAILHEVLVGIPTHALTGFAFWGMLGQIPLIALTKLLEKWRGKGSGLGNTIFWITFCVVGQPTIALLYYYQWAAAHKQVGAPI
ncbi:hypothetical protein NQZ79_g463 [Umbelopsis isabellina]|nr:hypothetical protein NQZ79_g463 [Umbelopsis isabellina]